MKAYLIITTIIFGALAVIWTRENRFNFLLKVMFFGLFVVGLFLSLGWHVIIIR
jgi:hypothetical protein